MAVTPALFWNLGRLLPSLSRLSLLTWRQVFDGKCSWPRVSFSPVLLVLLQTWKGRAARRGTRTLPAVPWFAQMVTPHDSQVLRHCVPGCRGLGHRLHRDTPATRQDTGF